MESEMYIKDQNEEEVIEYNLNSKKNGQQQQITMKYASTNSIPSTMEEENENTFDRRIMGERFAGVRSAASAAILRESTTGTGTTTNSTTTNTNPSTVSAVKARRYSVLEDLKARRDSLWQRARRTSTFEEKENAKQQKIVYGKEKRRSSDSGAARRGSVFYVTDDLLEEKQDVIVNKEEERAAIIEAKKGRRKSWHPLAGVKPSKSERKRKKAVVGAPPEQVASAEALYTHTRQKRPSWWNIFVPDSVSRSRRMSQDVTHSRSTESLIGTYTRSKSRSVDHGFTAPFDLDTLRNKVEGRFESVDKLSKDSDNESKDGSTTQEKRHGRISQPNNTIAYTVGDRDTLTSVAARFDTTPSELSKLNRLGSTFIYSGQQLWVPNKGEGRAGGGTITDAPSPDPPQDHDSQDDLPPEEKELLDNLRPVSPKPGHIERVKTPLGSGNAVTEDDEQPFKERFLKINVRHITDGQGVVGGVLLVTPNAVMFDPNVSDPLVIEHGAESYGVIAPMEFVVNAAIYYDIAHMRVGHTKSGNLDKKPDIYYMKKPSQGDSQKSQSPGKDETFPELAGDDNESVCSCAEREGDAFPKAFDRELVTPTNLQSQDDNLATTKEKEEKEKDSTEKEPCVGGQASRTLEERRRSMLDHHWAVPSKDRSTFSVDDEQQDSLNSDKTESAKSNAIPEDEEGSLVKLSCHDSGIDIRDPNPPLPVVQPMPSKKVYSDADIVLSSEWVPPITIAPTNITTSSLDSGPNINGRKKASSVSFSLDSNSEEPEKDEEHKDDDKQESRKNKMLKRLSYPLSWVGMEGLTGDREEENKSVSDRVSSLPNSADSHHSSVFSKVFSRRSSVGTFIRQQPLTSSGSSSVDSNRGSKSLTQAPRLDYRSMVSVEDMPGLFVSFDIQAPNFPELEGLELIPRPARSCEDPPLYLRLRTGRPKDKKIPRSTPIMSYGKKKLRPEYWFSVPRNRVDDLYRFIHAWVPNLYGELDENYWRERGYILSDTDTDLSPELTPQESGESGESTEEGKARNQDGDEISELTRESWELIKAPYVKLYTILKTSSTSADSEQVQDPEVLSMSEELRRALYANSAVSLDNDIIVPDLVGTTEILSDEHREHLCRHLPARAEGYLWTLVFSTSQHGFSLNSMYRKMGKIESPILLVIEDTEGNVFGALTSCALHVSDHFYGTGESLLFRFTPRFQAFNWTGDNLYFIKGNNESLAIGAGDGKFGLWLDGDLYQGRTQSCSTYGNEPLAPHEDFVVKTLECWAFI
ncbi:nuclear receptor coactivator 7 isoform X7 [Vespula pensylvanica]|uniref:nuclear receptor coactivator 7 isoform X7 n=1 Tax=Vespula pensylvanica TaxID=30213 RepID=UPI001CBA2BF1|nr:nuclear receptor coactivator 7 isoform X7 [Vespula pensylvanica]